MQNGTRTTRWQTSHKWPQCQQTTHYETAKSAPHNAHGNRHSRQCLQAMPFSTGRHTDFLLALIRIFALILARTYVQNLFIVSL